MVRFEFQGQVYDRDVEPHQYAITAEARSIAGWAGEVASVTIEVSPSEWTVSAQSLGQTVTAEVTP